MTARTMADWMAMALGEAARGLGDTSPNPAVGAVIVHRGRVIARGHHTKFGGLHAEIEALNCLTPKQRRLLPRSTLVVTLEPCAHFGKTPPCVDALIRARVGRVVVGMLDPHDIVAGRGAQKLRRAKIQVDVLDAPEVRAFYEPYTTFHRQGRSFVTLKLALSTDGKIAGPIASQNRWISGRAARAEVQRIRRRVDAIIIGRRTAQIDNPHLTLRPPFRDTRRRSPARVILTASGGLAPSLRLFTDVSAPTIVVTSRAGARRLRKRSPDIETMAVSARGGAIDLARMLRQFAKRGMAHVLVEGGAETANRFLDKNLADEIILFISPKIIGEGGVSAFRPRRSAAKTPFSRMRLIRSVRFGRDLMLVFRRAGDHV